MNDIVPALPHLALAGGAFVALLAGCAALQRSAHLPAESTRKLFHAGVGLIALALPLLFDRPAPVAILCAGSCVLLGLVRWHRAAHRKFGHVLHAVERRSYGEFAFAAAVALSFAFAHERPLFYAVPLATLTFADAAAALVGTRFGRHRYRTADGHKSVEGSLAFCAVAFGCAAIPLVATHAAGPLAALLVALSFAVVTTWVEAVCWCGGDNLAIPLAGGAALTTFVSWSSGELATASALLLLIAAGTALAACLPRTVLPIARG